MLGKIFIEKDKKKPLYLQLTDGIKKMIDNNTLIEGDKLPSIRATAKYFTLSKTTVEMSYQILLAEGYLESKIRAGYFISGLKNDISSIGEENIEITKNKGYKYDFSSYYLDDKYFDKSLWKRHLNYVLRDEKNLNIYGENQGELELRKAIRNYLVEYRGVNASSNEIIIGAGFQSLFQLILPKLREKYRSIVFNSEGFPSGEFIFKQANFNIEHYKSNNIYSNCIQYIKSDENYFSNYKEKINFLRESYEKNILIIEDDYNGEFRSFKRPLPALKSLDTFDNIIYFGAFSSILAPSIRISYLVVPKFLLEDILINISFYNQTSSTIEQLALAKFINNGYLGKLVRKMRNGYIKKRELLIEALDKYFKNKYKIFDTDSTVEVKIKFLITPLIKNSEDLGIKLKETTEENTFILIFAGLPDDYISKGIKELAKSWQII